MFWTCFIYCDIHWRGKALFDRDHGGLTLLRWNSSRLMYLSVTFTCCQLETNSHFYSYLSTQKELFSQYLSLCPTTGSGQPTTNTEVAHIFCNGMSHLINSAWCTFLQIWILVSNFWSLLRYRQHFLKMFWNKKATR